MNLRDRYICWHKDLMKTGLPQQVSINILNDTLQFCDDFMEQCDKLEKKVNDKSRVVRNLCKEIVLLKQELDQYRWRDVNVELPKVNQRCIVQFKDKDGSLYEKCSLVLDSDLTFYDPYTNGCISDEAISEVDNKG